MIIIIDYGVGNLGSILNMLKKIGADSKISSNPLDLISADKIILPGVGKFDHGINSLRERGFIDPLTEVVVGNQIPLLGICLGMQLLGVSSEEGVAPGLGWLKAHSVRYNSRGSDALRVPHMGWNTITTRKNGLLLDGLEDSSRFYFAHSYYVVCDESTDVLSTTKYGLEFVSSIQKNNIYGVQFHPEKSHRYGMKLLRNFVKLT
jgi:glutamine amidotransferase